MMETVRQPSATVGGVVVTYYPDEALEQRVESMRPQVQCLVLVDNTAEPATSERLQRLAKELDCPLVINPENTGVAAALNTGFKILTARGCHWAIAFDQDSLPNADLVDRLVESTSYRGQPAPAVVGANWAEIARPGTPSLHLMPDPNLPFIFHRLPAVEDLENVTFAITSGSLHDLQVWQRLGGFDSGLFIDLVDTDYCLRATAAGYRIKIASRARLAHRRGNKKPVRFLGRTWWPSFTTPERLRYQTRNRFRLYLRHAWNTPHWALYESLYAIAVILMIIFFEDRKIEKLYSSFKGFIDFLRGKSGKHRS